MKIGIKEINDYYDTSYFTATTEYGAAFQIQVRNGIATALICPDEIKEAEQEALLCWEEIFKKQIMEENWADRDMY